MNQLACSLTPENMEYILDLKVGYNMYLKFIPVYLAHTRCRPWKTSTPDCCGWNVALSHSPDRRTP